MKIDRLILQGFKSFGERTSLDFGPGVVGIVGPNGSGKSNIIEALRWTVGARARELRGEDAQSLLFHGSDGKAPLGFAEVNVEISRLSEGTRQRMQLSRRLERDNTAEVRLNGSRVPLKQVEQALAGTGLSRTGYAIVGQGEVGQILQAGPEILLNYLEEAAGLRSVTQASKLAKERLEAAATELQVRAGEMEERRASIAEKAQQAEAARQAAELGQRLLVLKRSVLQARIREAESEAAAASQKAKSLEDERAQANARMGQLEGEKKQALEGLEQAQSQHAEAMRQAEALSGELKLLEQQRQTQEALLRRLAQDLSDSESRLIRARAISRPTAPQLSQPTPQSVQDSEKALQSLQGQIRQQEQALRQQQQAFENYLRVQATFDAQQQAYQEALQEREAIGANELSLQAQVQQLSQHLQTQEAEEQRLRGTLQTAQQQATHAHSQASAAQAEADRLEAMIQSGSDLAEGPKRAKQSGIVGLVGVVADLLEVKAGQELAIEVAMGGRMQWVLCETEAAAQQAIAHLKQNGGRATFLPRTLLKPAHKPSRDYTQEPQVLGLARELVGMPRSPDALQTLLGDTLVLQTLEAALALRKRFPQAPRMVTLEGDLLETTGAITGGRVQKGGQMLALRRRFAQVSQEAQQHAADAQALAQQLQAQRQALEAHATQPVRNQLSQLSAELKALQANLSRLTQLQAPQPPQPVAAPDSKALEALQQDLQRLQLEQASVREAQAQWQRYREDQTRFEEAQQQITELQQRLHALREEQQTLAQNLSQGQTQRSQLEAQRNQLNLAALEATLQAARQRNRSLAEEESRLLARTNAVLSDLETQHLTQARREATVETLMVELREVPTGLVLDGSSRSLARQLSEVEQTLATIGPVNHLAEREYALLSEEIGKLEVALGEAQQVVDQLQLELDKVEAEYQARLEQVFSTFSDKFAQYAETLLGAEAQLQRIPSGLDLVLKPSGKRTVNLNLLSMGERTMGALAFLFALSEVGENGGLPIAVLDEVDAPLDEANIQRFCRFLRHFSAQTQFILVTHQKRTMEACDALYGVTTDRGLSKVYSIKRDEAVLGA